MPNAIKYNTSAETLALKKGNFWIGTGDVGKGPTSSTGYYNGITPPSGGYTIYLNKASGGPSIYTVNNDSQLIGLTNSIAGASYTTVNQCLNYFNGQSDKMCMNRDYEGIVTDGLVLNLDAGFTPSYPKNGTTWYDLSNGSKNFNIYNSPIFTSSNGGILTFDGVDDEAQLTGSSLFSNPGNYTIMAAFNLNRVNSQVWSALFSSTASLGVYDYLSTFTVFRWNESSSVLGAEIYSSIGTRYVDGPTITSDVWYIYTITVKSGVETKLYQNNNLVTTTVIGTITNNPIYYSIGCRTDGNLGGAGSKINGKLGFLYVWNRVLTESEITQTYNAQKGRFGL